MMTYKLFLDGVELEANDFDQDYKWKNFDAGDKVYVEDFSDPRTDGLVHVFFEMMNFGAVWLVSPDDVDSKSDFAEQMVRY